MNMIINQREIEEERKIFFSLKVRRMIYELD